MTTADPAVLDRPVTLHHLTFLDEGDEVTVGRPDNDTYIHLPADGAALIRRLAAGDTPHQAADWYHREYGDTVDMADFLATLAELDFIAADAATAAPPPAVRWRRLGAVVFSRWAMAGYAVLVAAMCVVWVVRPEFVPQYAHAFYTPSLVVVMLTLFVGQFPFLLLHEAAHALAGRRIGLNSRLRISRRLYFIVFETSMDGLVSVPRRSRYLPILAGVLADAVATAVLVLTAAAVGGVVAGACLAIALTNLLRMLWQCYFFLRTDLYYLVVTVLGCTNLHTASRDLLKRRVLRLLRRPVPDAVPVGEADRRAARWYSWLLPLGYAALLFSLGYVVIPSLVHVVVEVVDRIREQAPLAVVVDSLVVALLVFGQFVIAGVLALRQRRRTRTAAAHT